MFRTNQSFRSFLAALSLLALLPLLETGCISSSGRFARSLSDGLSRIAEPEIARQAAPAAILLGESVLSGDPDDAELLNAVAVLYSMYGT